MATPSTKATLKSYCLRALGFGVIDINVSDDQADDRLDEALQYFAQYHYDGIEKMYLKHLITSDEVTRARADAETTATETNLSARNLFEPLVISSAIYSPCSVSSVLNIP